MSYKTETRRERLIAKLVFPEIDTQRTTFFRVRVDMSKVYLTQPGDGPNSARDVIELQKWRAKGRQLVVEAKLGYSYKRDICVISYALIADSFNEIDNLKRGLQLVL